MRLNTILIQLLLLSEGLPGVVCDQTLKVTEGQDITVKCWFKRSGSKRIFCKNNCNNKRNILLETTEKRAEEGRYSITFDKKTYLMTVRIKKVTLSDSGPYQCWLERTLWSDGSVFDSTENIRISITKAPPAPPPPPPRVPPVIPKTTAVRPTHSPDPSPDPGLEPDSDPSPGPDSTIVIRTEHEQQTVTPLQSQKKGSLLFPVGVTLAVILTLFSAVLLIFYKKKKNSPKEVQVNAESQEVPEGDREYEEVPEQQVQSRSDCGSDIYSLASASAHPQVDPVLYSELDFNRNSAPHSQAEAVLYSAVRTRDTLYSTVSVQHHNS